MCVCLSLSLSRADGRWPVKELFGKIDSLWDSIQARCCELAVSSESSSKVKGEVKYVMPAGACSIDTYIHTSIDRPTRKHTDLPLRDAFPPFTVYGVVKPTTVDDPSNGGGARGPSAPAGDVRILIVTHKSITRSMLCRVLGLGPDSFRLFDINNGGMCVIKADARGNKMITAVNLTAHMDVPQAGIQYQIL